MIDIRNETLLTFAQIVRDKRFPRPSGKALDVSAVYRWVRLGHRGVKLEAVRVGGKFYTSIEAFQRWVEKTSGTSSTAALSPLQRPEHRRAEHAAKAAGF